MEHNKELNGTKSSLTIEDLEKAKELANRNYESMKGVIPDILEFDFVWKGCVGKLKDLIDPN